MTAPMSGENVLVSLSEAMAEAVNRAGKSTVTVDARRRHPASGIAYTPELILTADHVVERESEIRVFLPDGSQERAAIAGRDPGSDLALLRLERAAAQAAEIAPQEARVGQLALAIGRPGPQDLQTSLGVISAIGGPVRTQRGGLIERYLATDAIPYPGFSGGPLADAAGRVLGLNTSGLARGASLAIPAGVAWAVAETLAQHGHIRRGYLGIRSQPVDLPGTVQKALGRSQASGLLLVGVEDDSPASRGGLMVGDILIGIGGTPVSDPDELLGRLTGNVVGQPLPVEIVRGGQPQTIQVVVGERNSGH
jgi:S1-C subfamily serine protease